MRTGLKRNPVIPKDQRSKQAPWSAPQPLQKRVQDVAIRKGLTVSTYVQNVLLKAIEAEEAETAKNDLPQK